MGILDVTYLIMSEVMGVKETEEWLTEKGRRVPKRDSNPITDPEWGGVQMADMKKLELAMRSGRGF